MPLPKTNSLRSLAGLALAGLGACASAAGFQRALSANPYGKPLQIGIWYPSRAMPTPVKIGTTTMAVARDSPLNGLALPLVVVSRGTGSSFLGHADTAVAMAGDTYADDSRSVYVIDRPRHVSRAIDPMLSAWDGQAAAYCFCATTLPWAFTNTR